MAVSFWHNPFTNYYGLGQKGMMLMAYETRNMIYIDEFGNIARVDVPDAVGASLQSLQTMVDGLITITDGTVNHIPVDIIANDEALYRPDMGINLVASYMTGRQLVGPVVLATADVEGRTKGFGLAKLSVLLKDCLVDETIHTPDSIAEARAEIVDAQVSR